MRNNVEAVRIEEGGGKAEGGCEVVGGDAPEGGGRGIKKGG